MGPLKPPLQRLVTPPFATGPFKEDSMGSGPVKIGPNPLKSCVFMGAGCTLPASNATLKIGQARFGTRFQKR